jgi:hypothetical protein
MEVTGSCGCGGVTFEASVDETRVTLCHCKDCQTQSGSTFRIIAPAIDESFTLLTGELKSFEKVADSGTLRSRTFCPECGTQIYAKTIGEGTNFTGLRVGCLDQRDALIPLAEIWTRSKQPWLNDLSNLPSYEVQPTLDELGRIGKAS